MSVYFTTWRKRPGEIKIGKTVNYVEERHKAAQTYLGAEHTNHLVLDGDERQYQDQFKNQRLAGEWFALADGVLRRFVNSHPQCVQRLPVPRHFKPKPGLRGGSRKGKPQRDWPMALKVFADALWIRERGSIGAILSDARLPLSDDELGQRMDVLCPAWREYAPLATSSPEHRLNNRVFKMYYSGTSDRGPNHDPHTRKTVSGEHWLAHVTPDSELAHMHAKIAVGQVTTIEHWQAKFLDATFWGRVSVGRIEDGGDLFSEEMREAIQRG